MMAAVRMPTWLEGSREEASRAVLHVGGERSEPWGALQAIVRMLVSCQGGLEPLASSEQ